MPADKFLQMAVPVVGENEIKNVMETMKDGWISSIGGRFVTEFEQKFSAYCGVKHGVAVSNGTTALHVALVALGIGPGDEVIVPAITHIACANMISLTGARPVVVDCSPTTWGIDVDKIAAKLTPKTKAIMVVHLYGHPVDMDPVLDLARKRKLFVIEDAAEAHGATYKGKMCGGLGDIGCFSFYANKIITTGEGGMVVTNEVKRADRARKLRDQANEKERRFWHREKGFNYRMTNLQAAIGSAQVDRCDSFVSIRRKNAARYNERFRSIKGVTLPAEESWAKNVYWMYSLLINKDFPLTRDQLMTVLKEKQIESRPFFYPIHKQPAYADIFPGESCPVAERLGDTGINLPSGNELTEPDVDRVVEAVKNAGQNR